MLTLARQFLRPTATLLIAVMAITWAGVTWSQHDGTTITDHHQMMGGSEQTKMTPDAVMDQPCAGAAHEFNWADCIEKCVLQTPDLARQARTAAIKLPQWGLSAALFSATPQIAGVNDQFPITGWPPEASTVPLPKRPIDEFRILLI